MQERLRRRACIESPAGYARPEPCAAGRNGGKSAGQAVRVCPAGDVAAGVEAERATAEAGRARLALLEQENQAYFERFERYRGTIPWPWVLGAILVALGGGFLAGYWWLDATIRRRYGGFRMY